MTTVGLIPGSFDPFHNGHLEVVERASHIFDEIVVAGHRLPPGHVLRDLELRRHVLLVSLHNIHGRAHQRR